MIKVATVHNYLNNRVVKSNYPNINLNVIKAPTNDFQKIIFAIKLVLFSKYDIFFSEGTRLIFFIAIFKIIFFKRVLLICRPRLQTPPANPLLYLKERIKIEIIKKGVTHFIVISKSEIDNYYKDWKIAKEKMTFILFKVNTEEILYKLKKVDGDFIYSGGNSLRDYTTLFKAVEGLGLKVKVLSTLDFKNFNAPNNVEIIYNSGTAEEFYGPCARSKFAVFPIKPSYIRSAAQGSYLGAMYMGKAVIVSDTPGVRDIISDEINGLIVPPGDVEALREKILMLWHDANLRKRVEYNAQKDVKKNYTHKNYLENIYSTFNSFY